jgi:hypothetical protein
LPKVKKQSKSCQRLIASKKKRIERQLTELANIVGANDISVFCNRRRAGERFRCGFSFFSGEFENGNGI